MEWNRGPIIGRGSTATVSLATLVSSGELIAVKSTELSRSLFLQREQCVLSRISSAFVVNHLGFGITNDDKNNNPMYNLCMEYMPGGNLQDEIQRRGGRLEEQTIRLFTRQILQGVNCLHENGIAHCDVKSSNVLIGNEGAKIADLGCAKFVEEFEFVSSGFSGTPVFMAPEVARREEQGFAADIWAVGCTIIEMATGTNPWPELSDPVSALYRIGFSGESPAIPGWMSPEGKDFLGKCLMRDLVKRPTAKELLEHPFINGADEFNQFKKVTTSDSPRTVLDHGFWDSLEDTETSQNPTLQASPSSSSSSSSNSMNPPVQRIQQLLARAQPNWSSDEGWITVRSSGIEDKQKCPDDNEYEYDSIDTDDSSDEATLLVSVLIPHEELQVEETFVEDSIFSEFSIVNSSNSINFSIRREILLPFDNFVSENLEFEKKNGNAKLVQFSLLLSFRNMTSNHNGHQIHC